MISEEWNLGVGVRFKSCEQSLGKAAQPQMLAGGDGEYLGRQYPCFHFAPSISFGSGGIRQLAKQLLKLASHNISYRAIPCPDHIHDTGILG